MKVQVSLNLSQIANTLLSAQASLHQIGITS